MLSVPIIIRDCVRLGYPLDKVVHSVVGLADEIIISIDPDSIDDSLDYVFDLGLEVNSGTVKHGTLLKVMHSKWDLNNITSTGAEFARQTNRALSSIKEGWVMSIQADEAIHEQDHKKIKQLIQYADNNGIDAYSMVRLYFYGDINTIREDWTVPIVRFFKLGTRSSCGDAMNTEGTGTVVECDVPIYHYSRIGDPNILSKRILSLDKFFHPAEKLLKEEELEPYNFNTYNFDCQHKKEVDVGRKKVVSNLKKYTGTHPSPFIGYKGI